MQASFGFEQGAVMADVVLEKVMVGELGELVLSILPPIEDEMHRVRLLSHVAFALLMDMGLAMVRKAPPSSLAGFVTAANTFVMGAMLDSIGMSEQTFRKVAMAVSTRLAATSDEFFAEVRGQVASRAANVHDEPQSVQ